MKKALFLVDIQNDFCPGGSLAVPYGDKIVPIVNSLIEKFDIVVTSRDWHPADHKSFTTENSGSNVFDVVKVNGKDMVVWPPHCVQNTDGAKFHPDLNVDKFPVFTKGDNPMEHPFSGFVGYNAELGINVKEYFEKLEVKEVYVVGLAGDYCVKDTAIDCSAFFKTYLILDATRFIGEMNPTIEDLAKNGVMITNSIDLEYFMSDNNYYINKKEKEDFLSKKYPWE